MIDEQNEAISVIVFCRFLVKCKAVINTIRSTENDCDQLLEELASRDLFIDNDKKTHIYINLWL